jgi:very-short-patch-repair endonuclease
VAKRKKKRAQREWKSPIELAMRNAIVLHVARHDIDVSLYDYSTSAKPAEFIHTHGFMNVHDQDWDIDPQLHEYGDGDNAWSLYGDVTVLDYRADLLLIGHRCGPPIVIAIECDGHEWHERTKQQASSDRARDRHLLQAGILTLRFTGSDIFNRAAECAAEAWCLAVKLHKEADEQREVIFGSGYHSGREDLLKEDITRRGTRLGAAFISAALCEVG